MAAMKINLTKLACTINANAVNAVRGRSYENFFTQKFIIYTKVSLHENFQIYGSSFFQGDHTLSRKKCPENAT